MSTFLVNTNRSSVIKVFKGFYISIDIEIWSLIMVVKLYTTFSSWMMSHIVLAGSVLVLWNGKLGEVLRKRYIKNFIDDWWSKFISGRKIIPMHLRLPSLIFIFLFTIIFFFCYKVVCPLLSSYKLRFLFLFQNGRSAGDSE